MAISMPEVNFADLSRHGPNVVRQVGESPSRAVRVRRRDAGDDDLVLMTASRAQDEHEVMSATTRVFVAMMQENDRARDLLVDVVPRAFPWVRFLPSEDVQAFVVELVETLEAAEDLDQTPAPVLQVIEEWRNTAHVHADPELMEYLAADEGDLGSVAEPSA